MFFKDYSLENSMILRLNIFTGCLEESFFFFFSPNSSKGVIPLWCLVSVGSEFAVSSLNFLVLLGFE